MSIFRTLKSQFSHNLLNFPGWHSRRKIVVMESDDWGSIRMPSRAIYETLVKKNIRVDKLPYNRYDSLASVDDLTALFEVLHSVNDKNGNPAIITANTIVANPDFDRIRMTDFQEYFYEPFIETLKRYPMHSGSFELWKQGIEIGVFHPQFHGREHLNVSRWLHALQEDIGLVRMAFDYQMYDLSTNLIISDHSFMDALNIGEGSEIEAQKKILSEGMDLFLEIFKFRSSTFIPPCYVWSDALDNHLHNEGILAYQGGWFQNEPLPGKEHRYKKKFHYTGQKNKTGQYYLVRNAAFEPSDNPEFDWVNDVLKRAEIAFRWGKPLIISSHRLNYIGFIDTANRDRNLPLLKKLLQELVIRWPEVEFLSSDQLLNCLIESKPSC